MPGEDSLISTWLLFSFCLFLVPRVPDFFGKIKHIYSDMLTHELTILD
jgi:hypothetical protein